MSIWEESLTEPHKSQANINILVCRAFKLVRTSFKSHPNKTNGVHYFQNLRSILNWCTGVWKSCEPMKVLLTNFKVKGTSLKVMHTKCKIESHVTYKRQQAFHEPFHDHWNAVPDPDLSRSEISKNLQILPLL